MYRRQGHRPETGAVAVEFALVLPIFLLLIFGLIQYGFYFWSMQGGSSAVREAARRGAVGTPAPCDEFVTFVIDRVGVTSSDSDATTVKRSFKEDRDEDGVWEDFTPTVADPVKPGDMVIVSLTFQSYDMNFPFVPFIDGAMVSQTADSRVEYVPHPDDLLACT